MAIKKRKRMTFEKSSGNVFTDIGFANPERERLPSVGGRGFLGVSPSNVSRVLQRGANSD